jgi:CubicO group peptidase (beta-lactamase class C family)
MRRIVLLVALLGIAACGSGSASETAPAHPFDEVALEALAESLHADGANCVVVEHAGTIVGSWYWDGFAPDQLQEGFSTTKSVAATLVGIAADRGLLSLDDPASRWVTEWQGTPSEPVTVRQLLSNTRCSRRCSSGRRASRWGSLPMRHSLARSVHRRG